VSDGALNPYAVPTARVEDVGESSEADAIRSAHIGHEASIRSAGLLYYFVGSMFFLVMLTWLQSPALQEPRWIAVMVVFLVLGVGVIVIGWGVRKLERWARIAGSVVSALGLLWFPIGTLLNGYILYLLLSKKGGTVFSPEYKSVIAATPHIKNKTSVVVWVFLALLIGLSVLSVLVPLLVNR
jgi:hypothetical protein